MQVSAAGNSAESNVPGAAINMTVRTGGNQLSGSFYTDYEGESFQSENLTDELKDRGIGVGDKFDCYNELNVPGGWADQGRQALVVLLLQKSEDRADHGNAEG